MVDGPLAVSVTRKTYLVESVEHEEVLRAYETANYEVVRCVIEMEGGLTVQGCTFRFVDAEALD